MTDDPLDTPPVELSRLFHLAEFTDVPEHEITITASEAECDALAARYSLLSLDALSAQLTIRQEIGGEIIVEGRLHAELVQACVVTLEPVRDTLEATFDQRYTVHSVDIEDDLEIGPDDMEPPEPVIGDSIDLGELVAQYLFLSINPYPRAPEAEAQSAEIASKTEDEGPFAALAQLRDRDKN